MTTPASAFAGFIDDASALGTVGIHQATTAYAARPAADAAYVGNLVVEDTHLPLLRGATAPLHVVLGGGAGQIAGPVSLARRIGLNVAAVETTLRDLDDLAGNARRVCAAVDAARSEGDLGEDTLVYVAMPPQPVGPSWLGAADEVAGADLRLVLPGADYLGVAHSDLLAWIDAALDREIAVRFAGLGGAYGDPVTGHGFLNVLVATALLFDALPGAREALDADREALVQLWPTVDPDRGRRWFAGFASLDPEQSIADLRGLGL